MNRSDPHLQKQPLLGNEVVYGRLPDTGSYHVVRSRGAFHSHFSLLASRLLASAMSNFRDTTHRWRSRMRQSRLKNDMRCLVPTAVDACIADRVVGVGCGVLTDEALSGRKNCVTMQSVNASRAFITSLRGAGSRETISSKYDKANVMFDVRSVKFSRRYVKKKKIRMCLLQ